MIQNRTVIVCSLMFSVAIGLLAFGEFFEEVGYVLFPNIDPLLETETELIKLELKMRTDMLLNTNNDEFFFDMIKETDVYQAFKERYPTSEITKSGTNDASLVYTMFYTDYTKPYSAILVDFDISNINGSIKVEHRCMIKNYHIQQYREMPTLLWINAGVCQDAINEKRQDRDIQMVYDDDYEDMLLDAFEKLQGLITRGYSPGVGVDLVSVELDGDVIMLVVKLSGGATSVPTDALTADILDLVKHDVAVEIFFID